jgi:hypothetical protein
MLPSPVDCPFNSRRHLPTWCDLLGSTVLNNDRRSREKGLPGGDIAGLVAMDVEVLRVRTPDDATVSPARE